ncbi:MAG TPA: hypothetical protein VKE51_30315 [Vicinamibacterales bacterium]|nr:hypothetical protein [Vicinamibacterales bacterium]
MRAKSRADVVPKAIIAAIVGTLAGGAAGLWSLRRPPAIVNTSSAAPMRAASPVAAQPPAAPAMNAAADASRSGPMAVAPAPPAGARTEAGAPPAHAPQAAARSATAAAPVVAAADGDAPVLQRARTLARRPDVTALIALREDVVRRATQRGAADSVPVKAELEELDQLLNEARTLQLKLDAEEFRKADSKRPR